MINKLFLAATLIATIILIYARVQDIRMLEDEVERFSSIKSSLSILISKANNLREEINEANEKHIKMREVYNIKLWLLNRGIKPLSIGNNVSTVTVLVFYNDVLYPEHNKTSLEKYFKGVFLENVSIAYLQIYSPSNFNILKEIFSKAYQTRPHMQYEYVVFLNRNEMLILDLNTILSDLEVYTNCLKYFMLTA
ncbi:MAG: hypothetical protein QW563_00385 [Candidatus Methanomethylicia archaeon]